MIVIDSPVVSVSERPALHRALFLDRDGVINIDHGYVFRAEDFVFIEGIFELCRAAIARRFIIVVITNQAGIARGLYSEKAFRDLTRWMLDQFSAAGIAISRVAACPHHPDFADASGVSACPCRKPQPGMILRAAQDLSIDMAASVLIGDKDSDMVAALRAGVGSRVLYDPTGQNQKAIAPGNANRVITTLREMTWHFD